MKNQKIIVLAGLAVLVAVGLRRHVRPEVGQGLEHMRLAPARGGLSSAGGTFPTHLLMKSCPGARRLS
jgi:hypothetical protein